MNCKRVMGVVVAVVIIGSTGLCSAGEQRAALGEPPPGTKAWVVGDVLVNTDLSSHVNPSMTSAPNGDLYVAAEVLSTHNLRVYKSTDGGASWEFLVGLDSVLDLRNPSIAYGEHSGGESWVYVAYEQVKTKDDSRTVKVLRIGSDGNDLSISSIDGPFAMNSVDDQIHPQIITDVVEYGDFYIVYLTYSKFVIDGYPAFFSRSQDRGGSWTSPLNVSGAAPLNSQPNRPEIASGSSAGLFIAFVKPGWNGTADTKQVWVARSVNAGFSFSPPQQVTSERENLFHPSIAVASETNTVVVAYTVDYVHDMDVAYMYTTDAGTAWNLGGFLPFTTDHESSVDLAFSHTSGRFHAAYTHEPVAGGSGKILHTQADAASLSQWSAAAPINKGDTVSGFSFYPRPTIATVPGMPAEGDAAVAWTDFRGTSYGVYFATVAIFADGFESGDITAWSSSFP